MKEGRHVGIIIFDEMVRLSVARFRVEIALVEIGLDEHGSPLFTESVRQQLPPYMPELVVKMMEKMRSDDGVYAWVYLDVAHENWCTEFAKIESCDCNPVLQDHKIEEYLGLGYVTWICAFCDESSTGEGGVDRFDGAYRYWVRDGDREEAYWRFDDDVSQRLLCEHCARRAWIGLKGGWPEMTLLERTWTLD